MDIQKKYIVKSEDIGRTKIHGVLLNQCRWCSHEDWVYPFEPLGVVQEGDVGKMCVLVGDVWQVENEEQFKKRVSARR